MESRRDLRYCEYGITFVLPAFAASGAAGPALAVGLTTRGLFMPASAERPRTSAGDWGDVGGGTAGTLGDGFSDLRSARARRRRWMKHRASTVQSSIRKSRPQNFELFSGSFLRTGDKDDTVENKEDKAGNQPERDICAAGTQGCGDCT